MTTPAEKFSIRRILVALDASPQSLAALSAAVELSVKLKAELLGLFVEDVDLLRLADSPFARELLLPTAKETPLDRASMERELRAQADQARKALAKVANQAKVTWSFRIVRGRVPTEVLMASAGCDLLALGRIGWSFARKSAIGSTALAAIGEAVPALLLSSRATFAERPTLAWFDGTTASARGVLAAAELAQVGSGELVVLLPPTGQETNNHLRKQVTDLLKGTNVQLRCKYLRSLNQAAFLSAVQSVRPGVIVLMGSEPFPDKASLLALLDQMEVSTLFLGQA